MTGLILTAKHHDGFCLWPSKYTDYSVKNSKWKNGKGDVVKEFVEACKEYGLKAGIYLSPWDRHSAVYGTPEYITYYRNQLRELLTNYGDIFEVWFDGANGGTGYYGGKKKKIKINNKTYYDWPNTWKIVRELQPEAVMFSDAGPDLRWVGNENGYADAINWCLLDTVGIYPGMPEYKFLSKGNEYGNKWIPAECDVSIRPGWFYDKKQNKKVKSVEHLLKIYYRSVGRNSCLILNVPPDETGKINKVDVDRLKEFKAALNKEFENNLALNKEVIASSFRGNDARFRASNVTDENYNTYWATDDDVKTGSLTINLGDETEVNRIVLQEYIKLGQRVDSFNIEALVNGKWEQQAYGGTIGYKRILKFPTVKTTKIRINILKAKACPVINNIELYHAPDKAYYSKGLNMDHSYN